MEHLEYEFKVDGGKAVYKKNFSIVGVVASSNLEVMMEVRELGGRCLFSIDTAATGFGESWKAVVSDFVERHKPANLQVSVNDNAASPAVVSLRLDQGIEGLTGR
ncbi:MAG: malonate decarboxylase acyl carrier protein [Victivallales bacterium]|jgi:malonate decarboxylase delta subunit